jgi:ABC-type multidrug transport system fused ATPase/permease subunit
MVLAEFTLGDALLTTIAFFFLVMWIWLTIAIITDLLRDDETSGWAKAGWVLLLLILPYITTLIYLIARGGGMRERSIRAQAEAQKHMDTYIRQAAASSASPAEEIAKLADLKKDGTISETEYEDLKAKALA